MTGQWTFDTIDGIRAGARYSLDVVVGGGPLVRPAIVQIPFLAGGIGAQTAKAAAGVQAFVGHTGRDENGIARLDLDHDARVPAKLDASPAAADTQYLVGCAVVVMVAKHRTVPSVVPAVGGKDSLKGSDSLVVRQLDDPRFRAAASCRKTVSPTRNGT